MNFIKLTNNEDNSKSYYNFSLVENYEWEDFNKITRIYLNSGNSRCIKETPEEIDDLINNKCKKADVKSLKVEIQNVNHNDIQLCSLFFKDQIDNKTKNALERANIYTIGELFDLKPINWIKIMGIGEQCVERIKERLFEIGIDWRYYSKETKNG